MPLVRLAYAKWQEIETAVGGPDRGGLAYDQRSPVVEPLEGAGEAERDEEPEQREHRGVDGGAQNLVASLAERAPPGAEPAPELDETDQPGEQDGGDRRRSERERVHWDRLPVREDACADLSAGGLSSSWGHPPRR